MTRWILKRLNEKSSFVILNTYPNSGGWWLNATWIWTQWMTFETWDISDIWWEWGLDKKTKKLKDKNDIVCFSLVQCFVFFLAVASVAQDETNAGISGLRISIEIEGSNFLQWQSLHFLEYPLISLQCSALMMLQVPVQRWTQKWSYLGLRSADNLAMVTGFDRNCVAQPEARVGGGRALGGRALSR